MEFISPESPLSPATAAFLVLIVSSCLWKFFGIDQMITGVLLSFIFSAICMKEFKVNYFKKIFYIVINGILIFFTAVGGNTFISRPVDMNYYSNHIEVSPNERSFLDPWVNK